MVTVLLFTTLIPTVSAEANDTVNGADTIGAGTHYSYVCWQDDCSSAAGGIDHYDYFKFYVYHGDEVYVKVENTCDWDYVNVYAKIYRHSSTGWESDRRIGSGGYITCGSPTWISYSWTHGDNNGYRYLKITGIDDNSWPNGDDQAELKITLTIDSTNRDRDADGYVDSIDDCIYDYGTSWQDRYGCEDSDGDGWSNSADAFDYDETQWDDYDGDYFGDNPDGRWADACPYDYGTSWRDRYGCEDSDDDGASDVSIESNNTDGWNVWDGADAFELDPTQWSDRDNDGFGDNIDSNATTPDSCPFEYGTSTIDVYGCPDWDDDGYSDDGDDLPRVPTQHQDSDGDGFGDNKSVGAISPDGCVSSFGTSFEDRFGCLDSDGDGWSDDDGNWPAHPYGLADAFPTEFSQWRDRDDDGFGDNQSEGAFEIDACPITPGTSWQDRFGCIDSDGDGWSDLNDVFPNRDDQWADADGDGFGDNPDGQLEDDCPDTPGTSTENQIGCPDSDLDLYDDETDAFPTDGSQHTDSDDDGYGDALDGTRPDACPAEEGTSWLDRYGCPDSDGDGVSDDGDAFPLDSTSWDDSDGDGFGDNFFGPNRDDCPSQSGSSTIDRQGCPDSNEDGYSDMYGSGRALFARIGENPFTELASYGMIILTFLLSSGIVYTLRRRS